MTIIPLSFSEEKKRTNTNLLPHLPLTTSPPYGSSKPKNYKTYKSLIAHSPSVPTSYFISTNNNDIFFRILFHLFYFNILLNSWEHIFSSSYSFSQRNRRKDMLKEKLIQIYLYEARSNLHIQHVAIYFGFSIFFFKKIFWIQNRNFWDLRLLVVLWIIWNMVNFFFLVWFMHFVLRMKVKVSLGVDGLE
jgi:hypothetical protein